ncbi:ATP-binding response regulator [Allochromatium vinosum]|uniref:Response regulator receiver protein n=1 Tax=Allochromatium vinosum (strain ATCC 17899 / DSM 180 / NBRC 103801 / NCIMB 10441 / D) TaxID=572477 RepID=D3RN71_ALLVD|nr:response regulator [Allochromatium vinosum]ADC61355.1 response regulator receiver protein [Allochromatium vinosum DSM 180]
MAKLLVVDDEPINLEIIGHCLEDEHQLAFAEDGLEAWAMLEASPQAYDGVILDRMMPRMDGMEVLRRLKADKRFRDVPVIMQSAADSSEQVAEGLAAGAWYYLAKPYAPKALRSIVSAALDDRRNRKDLAQIGGRLQTILDLADRASFRFRTLEEVSVLSSTLAQMCPNPETVAMGLSELMLNAVEHGNLGIDYAQKGRLIEDGLWQDEVERRLAEPAQSTRHASVELERDPECLIFTIRDQGLGFDWQRYLDLDPARAFDSHGRGIAMARHLAFAHMEYRGAGNEVRVSVALTDPTDSTACDDDSI